MIKKPTSTEYFFIAKHQYDDNGVCCELTYRKIIVVTLLGKDDQASHIYNKDLKMWFQTTDIYEKYRIEIKDADVIFPKQYKKIEDLNRRLQYIYSGIEITLKNNNTIHSIDNMAELIKNWELRKQYILKDFNGDNFINEIKNIDQKITSKSSCRDIFSQYQTLGLLFPPICNTHRSMTIEPNYDIIIDETIEPTGTHELILSGENNEKSLLPLHSYEGSISVSPDFKVNKGFVKFSYGDKYINNCSFGVTKII